MSRLDIKTASKAQTVVDRLYKDMERRIASSPPGLCPIDMSLTFLQLCHAQSCGKCVPCRIGLGQLSILMGQVLDGTGTMLTIDTIEKTARAIVASADCAIGRDAAQLVLSGFEGFRDDYVNHVQHHRCLASLQNPVPCVSLCPAGVDVPGYVALVREGRYADAVRLIRKDNPMPTACAYICEHPCEARCRRNMVDAPVNIRGLKRYAVDHAGDVPNPACEKSTGKRVAIIGGGPSGLSCAYYLRLMGHSVTIFEEKKQLGGMLRYGIPAYRFPREKLDAEITSILSTGVEVHTEVTVGKDISFEQLHKDYDCLYVAIGAHTDKKTGIPGEDSKNVMSAVEMLRAIGDDVMPDFTGKRVVVIGGGPSGLSCAYYLRLMGHSVTIFEEKKQLGGMLRYGIPAYRFPREKLDAEITSILSTGVEVHTEVTVGKDISFERLHKDYDCLYVAIGAHTDKKTGIPGEDSKNVMSAVEMLRAIGDDVMPDFTGKRVVVIGGGNVAMDVTRSSVRLGASSVTCVYRRRIADMSALPDEVQGAIAEGAEIRELSAPVRIEANEAGEAAALWVQPQIIGLADKTGRPRPDAADQPEERIPADIIVVAIGQGVEIAGFEQAGIPIKRGTLMAESSSQIDNMENVFAGGDCVTGPATAIRAIAAGKVAAANIDEQLGFHHEIRTDVEIPAPHLDVCPARGRVNTKEREAAQRKCDFEDIECGMTHEEACAESGRCLRCDHFGYGIFKGGRIERW